MVNWITKRKNAYGIVLLVISLSLAGSWLLGRGMPEKKALRLCRGCLIFPAGTLQSTGMLR